ncbi:MAG: biotin/lipoyl-containing protein [Myxococcales bacterium]
MRYHAVLGGVEHLIDVTSRGGGVFTVVIDDRKLEVNAVNLTADAVSLLAGTRSARCDIEPGKDGKLAVLVGENVFPMELLDERRLRLRQAGGKFSLEGPPRIDAPMPGKVVRVMVKVGDEVAEGQGLIVVEAMKMENELRSPKAGKVTELHAVEGAAVESGARLAVVT